MTDSIFTPDQGEVAQNQEAPSEVKQEAPVSPPAPVIPPELAELVGEGKKWRDLSEAQKAIPHAQAHIAKLEAELQAEREERAKSRAAEQLLEEMRTNTAQQKPTSQGVEVNEDVLSQIVEKKLQQQSLKQQQDSNARSVVSSFSAAFADKAESMYDKIAEESGFTRAQFNQLASTNPKAVLKLAGLSQNTPAKSSSAFNSDVNTATMSNRTNDGPVNAKVVNYGSSKDVQDAMARAIEMVNKRHSL